MGVDENCLTKWDAREAVVGPGQVLRLGSSAMSAYLCCVWQTRPSRAQTVPAPARGHSRTPQASQFAPAPLPPPSLAHPVTTSGVVRHTTVLTPKRRVVADSA